MRSQLSHRSHMTQLHAIGAQCGMLMSTWDLHHPCNLYGRMLTLLCKAVYHGCLGALLSTTGTIPLGPQHLYRCMRNNIAL